MNFSAILIHISLISEAALPFMVSNHLLFLFGTCTSIFLSICSSFYINFLGLPFILGSSVPYGMSCKYYFSVIILKKRSEKCKALLF